MTDGYIRPQLEAEAAPDSRGSDWKPLTRHHGGRHAAHQEVWGGTNQSPEHEALPEYFPPQANPVSGISIRLDTYVHTEELDSGSGETRKEALSVV